MASAEYAPLAERSVKPGIWSGKLWLSTTCQWNWLSYKEGDSQYGSSMVGYEGTYLDRAHAIQRALNVGNWETTQVLVILHVLSAYTTGNSGCSTPVIALYYDRDNTPQVTWPGLLSGTCLQDSAGPEKALRNSRQDVQTSVILPLTARLGKWENNGFPYVLLSCSHKPLSYRALISYHAFSRPEPDLWKGGTPDTLILQGYSRARLRGLARRDTHSRNMQWNSLVACRVEHKATVRLGGS